MFAALVDLSGVNSYILWKYMHSRGYQKLGHSDFMEELATGLLKRLIGAPASSGTYIKTKKRIGAKITTTPGINYVEHEFEELNHDEEYQDRNLQYKLCFVCSKSNMRYATKFYCTKYNVACCLNITTPDSSLCWQKLHVDIEFVEYVNKKAERNYGTIKKSVSKD